VYGKPLTLNNAYKKMRYLMSNFTSTNKIKEFNHMKNTKLKKIRLSILNEQYNLNTGIYTSSFSRKSNKVKIIESKNVK